MKNALLALSLLISTVSLAAITPEKPQWLKEDVFYKKSSLKKCYCQARNQKDSHRKYCVGDEKVQKKCVRGPAAIPAIEIDFYEAFVVDSEKRVTVSRGYDTKELCQAYLKRRSDCQIETVATQ